MLSQLEYQWIWWAYFISSGVFIATFYWFIRKLKWVTLKSLLIVMLGIVLFTPVFIVQDEWRAPAIIVLVLDAFLGTGESSSQVASLLSKSLMVGVAFVILLSVFLRLIFKK